mgnify:CR=1 FL=1
MPATNFNLLTNIFASFRVTAPPIVGYMAGQIIKSGDTVAVVVENLEGLQDGAAVYKAEKIKLPCSAAEGPLLVGSKVYADVFNGVIVFNGGGGTFPPCGILVDPVEVGDVTCIIDLDGTLAAHYLDYSQAAHDHDGDYSLISHDHNLAYSLIGHDHDLAYSVLTHNHDLAYSAIDHTHT